MKKIFVGVRVDFKRPWLQNHFSLLKSLDYQKEDLRIVYSVRDSMDSPSLVKTIKQFGEESGLSIEVYRDPPNIELRKYGVEMGASIFHDWQSIFNEDYFLLLDSDIVSAPPYLIKELLRVGQPIAAPYIYTKGSNVFYDTFKFRLDNRMFNAYDPPGRGLVVPIEIDSAGGCMLVKGEVFKEVEVHNPYPTVSLCYDAKRRGYRTVGLPYLIVYHEDLMKHGIFHSPLPQSFGMWPSNFSVTSLDQVRTLETEPMPLYEDFKKTLLDVYLRIDTEVLRKAQEDFQDPVIQKEKSLKWAYNINKFRRFYFSRDPWILAIYYYLEPLPEWIEIEPTTYCNLKCRMCERTYWKEPNRHMTFEEFKSIVDQFPNLKWIGLTGIGEGLCNPDFLKMIHYIKEKDPAIYIEIFDPFVLTTEKVLKDFVEVSLDKIYVSIDAASKETYEFQRPGAKFERVLENIKTLDRIKKEEGKHFPQLCFHYIINKYNINEVLDFLDLVKNLGVDTWFIQFTRMLHPFREVRDMFVQVPPNLELEVRKKAAKLGLQVYFNANVPLVKPPTYQCSAYIQPFIFVTGHVIPCCCMNEQNDREWQKRTSLGNVFEAPFKEIWTGERYRELRKALYTGRIHEICKACPLFNSRWLK